MSIRVSEREETELGRGKLKDILESHQNTQKEEIFVHVVEDFLKTSVLP